MKAAFMLLVCLFFPGCSSSEAEVTDEHILKVLKPTSRTNQQEWLMLHSQHVAEVETGQDKASAGVLGVHGDSTGTVHAWPLCSCLHVHRAIWAHGSSTHPLAQCGASHRGRPSAADQTLLGTAMQVWDLIVYGDSITEAFRGTTVGFRSERWSENEAAWAALVTAPPPPARRYNAAVYSISGELILQEVCCSSSH